MKKIIIIFICLFCFNFNAAEIVGKVIKVYDGDTVTLIDNDNKIYKIRLDKIDAPERGQEFGKQSQHYLSKLVLGKTIKVHYSKIDRYKRLLGILYIDNIEVNLKMLLNGYAWHYRKYDKTPLYINAEKQARKNKIGLWKKINPINPEMYRKMKKSKLLK